MTIRFIPTRSDNPFLLAADIDGTLLGNAQAESWLFDFVTHYPESIYLAYMTGRSYPSVNKLIDEDLLPPPHYICSHVGTELFDYRNPDDDINTRFTAAVDTDQWYLDKIYRYGKGEGVQRQVFTNGQPPFHAGFLWDGSGDTLKAFSDRMKSFDSCLIIVSHGMFIDVIPEKLGKGNAVYFLKEQLHLTSDNIVVAGDSGNDSSMFDTPFKAIIPCNGLLELKGIAGKPWHYHSPYEATHGVFDGLNKFGFIKHIS